MGRKCQPGLMTLAVEQRSWCSDSQSQETLSQMTLLWGFKMPRQALEGHPRRATRALKEIYIRWLQYRFLLHEKVKCPPFIQTMEYCQKVKRTRSLPQSSLLWADVNGKLLFNFCESIWGLGPKFLTSYSFGSLHIKIVRTLCFQFCLGADPCQDVRPSMPLILKHLAQLGLISGSNSSMFVEASDTTRFCVGVRYSRVFSKGKTQIQRNCRVTAVKRE